MSLEVNALRWLWIEKNCPYILEQRSPRYGLGIPDALGVTQSRKIIEIEIKRTVADFKNDKNKKHRQNQELQPERRPYQFYYLVPESIVEKITQLVPEWAGLMASDGTLCRVLKKAPSNSQSKKMTLKECAKMARLMANHMMSEKIKNHTHTQNFLHRDETYYYGWPSPDVGLYAI